MKSLVAPAIILVGACNTVEPLGPQDIVGPYTGERTRYVVDQLVLPTSQAEVRMFGTDLNGDKSVDNQLGMVCATVSQLDTEDPHVDDRIASGELAIVVEIQADDLLNDDRAGVWVYGAGDTDVRPTGGEFVGGAFIPNFVRLVSPENTGSATLPMPILPDADTMRMEVAVMEISLVPDGNGGYDAQVRGGVRNGSATARAAAAQQLANRPSEHRWLWSYLDQNRDGVMTPLEWDNSYAAGVVTEDIEIGGEMLLSFGIGFHLSPCASGNCALGAVDDHCFDRVRDGDETDIDCGGTCSPCAVDRACASGADCQSGTCGASGCTAPRCDDGIKNGFEASTDCGGTCAQKCVVGQVCGFDFDCETRCTAVFAGDVGVCES